MTNHSTGNPVEYHRRHSSISALPAITIGIIVIILIGVGLYAGYNLDRNRIPETVPMSLGPVYLFSSNSTFSFTVYNPPSNTQTGIVSVVVNGSSCISTAWRPVTPSNSGIEYVSESCVVTLHIVSGQQYSFKVSFSNGVSISGTVKAT